MKKSYPVKPAVRIGEVFEEKCHHCGGSGQEPGLSDLTCRECVGQGRRRWRIEECKACGGPGPQKLNLHLPILPRPGVAGPGCGVSTKAARCAKNPIAILCTMLYNWLSYSTGEALSDGATIAWTSQCLSF